MHFVPIILFERQYPASPTGREAPRLSRGIVTHPWGHVGGRAMPPMVRKPVYNGGLRKSNGGHFFRKGTTMITQSGKIRGAVIRPRFGSDGAYTFVVASRHRTWRYRGLLC